MMTAEELKNSILCIALQGKLVEQNLADESAQELLERIRKEKKAQIKSGKVPKDKKMNDVSEDEQFFDLPENWAWTRMGEIFQHNTGKALNGSNKDGKLLTYITTSNLYWNRFELDNLKSMPFTDSEVEKCTATKGDLLVCEGGDYGRAAIWNFDYDIRIQNHVHRLRAYIPVCTEYFYYVINFLKSTGLIKGKGIGIQGLSSGALHNLAVPLPPIEEQKRIVAKIEELMPFVEQYASASTKLNTLNATFPDQMKKSILQQAVQGKLVPQDPNDEPASVLLKKIAEEKQRLIKEGKIKKQKKLPPITEDEIPFEIPESWEWIRFADVCTVINGDRGKNYPSKATLSHEGIPFISALNLDGKTVIQNDSLLCVSEEQYNKLGSGKLIKGDIVVCIRGSLGKHGRYPFEKGAIASSLVICRQFIPSDTMANYLMMYLDSPLFFNEIKLYDNGTAQPNLAAKSLEQFLIPIPPVDEQSRILERLNSLIPDIEELEVSAG